MRSSSNCATHRWHRRSSLARRRLPPQSGRRPASCTAGALQKWSGQRGQGLVPMSRGLLASYFQAENPPAEMAREVDAIRARHPDAAKRMLDVLALVRDRLRTRSLAGGRRVGSASVGSDMDDRLWRLQGRRPHVRGDGQACRYDGACAFISTTFGLVLDSWLPSPSIFRSLHRARPPRRATLLGGSHPARQRNQHDGPAIQSTPGMGVTAVAGGRRTGAYEPAAPPADEKRKKRKLGKKVSSPATLIFHIVYHSIRTPTGCEP